MDMPEGAEGHSVASDGVGALIEGPKVAITQTRLYLDGAPGQHVPKSGADAVAGLSRVFWTFGPLLVLSMNQTRA